MVAKLVRNLFLPIVMAFLVCLPLEAREGLSLRQQEIWQTIMSGDGYLSEEMHSDFWVAMPKSMFKDDADKAAYLRFMEKAMTSLLKFQREAWRSVRASMNAGQVVKTPGYDAAKAEVLSAFDGTGSKQNAASKLANGERMIEAAAKGQPIETPNGPAYLTPELVDQVLAGMDGSLARAAKLLNPVWEDKPVEHLYPDAHVKILWDGEFAKEVQYQTGADGRKFKIVSLLTQLSEEKTIGINFLEQDTGAADFERDIIRVARGTLRGMGIDEPTSVIGSTWRGRQSVIAAGTAVVSGVALAGSVRVVEVEEHEGVLLIMGLKLGSTHLEAQLLREDLEKRLQILD
jgi:hypothetical protein